MSTNDLLGVGILAFELLGMRQQVMLLLGMSAMETLGMRIRIRLGMSTNNLIEMGKQMISRDVSK